MVYHTLVILLVRTHRAVGRMKARTRELLSTGQNVSSVASSTRLPHILNPVIALLQYDSFVTRLRRIFGDISSQLKHVGIACETNLTAVSDDVHAILARAALLPGGDSSGSSSDIRPPSLETSVQALLAGREEVKVNGEATLRVGGQ